MTTVKDGGGGSRHDAASNPLVWDLPRSSPHSPPASTLGGLKEQAALAAPTVQEHRGRAARAAEL